MNSSRRRFLKSIIAAGTASLSSNSKHDDEEKIKKLPKESNISKFNHAYDTIDSSSSILKKFKKDDNPNSLDKIKDKLKPIHKTVNQLNDNAEINRRSFLKSAILDPARRHITDQFHRSVRFTKPITKAMSLYSDPKPFLTFGLSKHGKEYDSKSLKLKHSIGLENTNINQLVYNELTKIEIKEEIKDV